MFILFKLIALLLRASEKLVLIMIDRAYSHQLRNLSCENHNIVCIIQCYTEYIPLALRIHSEGFELVATTEIMARSTTRASLPILK